VADEVTLSPIEQREQELKQLQQRDYSAFCSLYQASIEAAGVIPRGEPTIAQMIATILDHEFPPPMTDEQFVLAKYPEAVLYPLKPSLLASERWWIRKTSDYNSGHLAQQAESKAAAWAMAAEAIRSGADLAADSQSTAPPKEQRSPRLPRFRKRRPLTRVNPPRKTDDASDSEAG
jgi:hypothetical protein